MRLDHVHHFPRLRVPHSDSLIEGPGHDHIAAGAKINTKDVIRVATEGFHAVEEEGVPDAESGVVGGGAYVVGVGGPGQVGDAGGVAGESGERGERLEREDDEGLVEGGGGEELAGGGEFDAGDGEGVAG